MVAPATGVVFRVAPLANVTGTEVAPLNVPKADVELTVSVKPDAQKFFQFLLSGTALVFFERYGFTYLVKAGP